MIYKCKENRVSRTYVGGHRIDRLRGKDAPDGYRPEEWIASTASAWSAGGADPYEGLSFIDGEENKTLADVLAENPSYLGGYEKLPILLKLLDASERLVIQAHPTAEYAMEHLNSPFGKAECWYIISADEDAHIYLGFKEGVTREAWVDAFERQDVDKMLSMLHKLPLKAGDVWYVEGGVPHAIGGGCLMAELQEPTDLMVVPERVTPSGRVLPEQRLHCGLGFEKMFDVFDYTGYDLDTLKSRFYRHTEVEKNSSATVIGKDLTDKFRMDEYYICGEMDISTDGLPGVGIIIGGNGVVIDGERKLNITAGEDLFFTADDAPIHIFGEIRILVAVPNKA